MATFKRSIRVTTVGGSGDGDRRRLLRSTSPLISIVVPAKNEARNLELILPELPCAHEVILVDGHSADDTIATARRVLPSIRVVQQSRLGKGNALVCGFTAATGDIIVMFDADGSADPNEIPRFVDALIAGADFAKGSRFLEGGGSEDITGLRSKGNHVLGGLTNTLFKTRFTDLCYGYNAFWLDILGHLDLPSPGPLPVAADTMVWGDGFEIETLLNCRVAAAKLSVTEVPSVERLRIHGVSNLNAFSDGMRVLRTVLVERHRKSLGGRTDVSLLEPDSTTRCGAPLLEHPKVTELYSSPRTSELLLEPAFDLLPHATPVVLERTTCAAVAGSFAPAVAVDGQGNVGLGQWAVAGGVLPVHRSRVDPLDPMSSALDGRVPTDGVETEFLRRQAVVCQLDVDTMSLPDEDLILKG